MATDTKQPSDNDILDMACKTDGCTNFALYAHARCAACLVTTVRELSPDIARRKLDLDARRIAKTL